MKPAGSSATMSRPSGVPSHDLVIFLKQLGDTVLLEPAIAKLADDSGSPVALHVKPELRPVVELMDRCQYEPLTARRPFQRVWCFERGSKAAFRAWRARAAEKHLRLRKPQNRRWFHGLVFRQTEFNPSVNLYSALFYWRSTPGVGEFRPPKLNLPPESWQGADLPGKYILINPVAGAARKCWPAAKWAELIHALPANYAVALTAPTVDWAAAHIQEICAQVQRPLLNLTGKTKLKEYLYLISRAELALAVDGACSHLAQAFGGKVITIFSETNPANPCSWHYPTGRSVAICERRHAACRDHDGRPVTGNEVSVIVNRLLAG